MKNKSIAGLALSMLIFGTIGIFRRYIPLPSGIIAMTRGFVGAAFLLLVILIGRKRFDFCAVKKNILALIVSGAFIGQMLNGFKKPSVELAVRIAEQLGCLVDDIVVKQKQEGE